MEVCSQLRVPLPRWFYLASSWQQPNMGLMVGLAGLQRTWAVPPLNLCSLKHIKPVFWTSSISQPADFLSGYYYMLLASATSWGFYCNLGFILADLLCGVSGPGYSLLTLPLIVWLLKLSRTQEPIQLYIFHAHKNQYHMANADKICCQLGKELVLLGPQPLWADHGETTSEGVCF